MKSHCAGAAIVILLAVQSIGFIVTAPEFLFNRHSDLVAEHIATQTVLYDSWQGGEGVPLWRHDQLSGAPAFTNPQAAYTYPLHTVFAFFNPARAIGLVIWLDLVLAALGAYLAAAVLKLSMPARVLTAMAALLSLKSILAAYAGWMPQLGAVAALPFLFAAALVALDRPSLASTIALALAGTLALHAGHPQITYYAIVFITMWSAVWLVRMGRTDVRIAVRMLAVLIAGGALALGLSAYRLLPIAADLPLVTRSDANSAFFMGVGPLPVGGLFTVFNPEFFGTPLDDSYPEGWEYILYLGGVPTLLAAFAFAFGPMGPHLTALRIGTVLSAALAIDSPLLRLVADAVPAYGLFRMPARILFLTAFFAFCLAGVGLDDLLARIPARRRRFVAVLLVAAVVVEGTYWARRYLRPAEPVPFPVSAPYVEALRTERPARVAPLSISTPSYGFASPLGLELVTGYDPFIFRHYQTYIDLIELGRPAETRSTVWATLQGIARWDLLDALNVAVVVSPGPLPNVPLGYVLAQTFDEQPQFRFYEGLVRGPVYVYRNTQPLERAFFVSSVLAVTNEDEMLDGVMRATLRNVAVVLGPGGPSEAGANDRVAIVRAAGGIVELSTQSAERRFLVVSEVWHPGWRATVDGRPTTLHRANIALQGLWLEPGTHHVELRFWPSGLSAGLIVTGATIAGVMMCLVWLRQWGRRSSF